MLKYFFFEWVSSKLMRKFTVFYILGIAGLCKHIYSLQLCLDHTYKLKLYLISKTLINKYNIHIIVDNT